MFLSFHCFLQTAIVFASENGLKVTTEDAKCVQANAFIQSAIFQHFSISQEQATFKLNLTVLLVREISCVDCTCVAWSSIPLCHLLSV